MYWGLNINYYYIDYCKIRLGMLIINPNFFLFWGFIVEKWGSFLTITFVLMNYIYALDNGFWLVSKKKKKRKCLRNLNYAINYGIKCLKIIYLGTFFLIISGRPVPPCAYFLIREKRQIV